MTTRFRITASAALLLGLIDVVNRASRETVTGSIEPVRARIRDGVVTYDRFLGLSEYPFLNGDPGRSTDSTKLLDASLSVASDSRSLKLVLPFATD